MKLDDEARGKSRRLQYLAPRRRRRCRRHPISLNVAPNFAQRSNDDDRWNVYTGFTKVIRPYSQVDVDFRILSSNAFFSQLFRYNHHHFPMEIAEGRVERSN